MLTNTGRPSARKAARRDSEKTSDPDAASAADPVCVTAMPLRTASAASKATVAADWPKRRLRPEAVWLRPSTQPANPSRTKPVAVARTPAGPASWLTTHNSQTAAPYIGKARPCFRNSIQRPGRGMRPAIPGRQANAI